MVTRPYSPGTMVATRPRLLQRTMSGSMVLPQPRSMLMSHGVTKGHMKPQVWDATCGLVGDQVLLPEPFWSEWSGLPLGARMSVRLSCCLRSCR